MEDILIITCFKINTAIKLSKSIDLSLNKKSLKKDLLTVELISTSFLTKI